MPPLAIGPHQVWPPVVLAPMAGITNVGFRQLCREQGGGIYVCEMITTVALVERNPKTLRMIAFGADERPRSLQLYGTDPETTAAAVRIVVERNLADHVDLNFGCPVPKVTRRGGGAALPWRRRLFARLVRAAVAAASPAGVPVTVKMRKGIDDDHLTYVEAGLAAQEAGVAAVALHGRTAAQRYSGTADWDAIATLKQALDVPVLGNGDIWEADDALRMVAHTGVDGVVIGRGCLGRPWLFADLEAAFNGSPQRRLPTLGEVAVTMRRHAELLVEQFTAGARNPARGERDGCTDFRKHVAWYLKGFPVGSELRRSLAMIDSLAQLDDLLGKLDPAVPFPVETLGQPRGRTNSPGKVFLPDGWLASRDDDTVPEGAELDDSGG
ncbi:MULTISPECIES: tRNA dihydrouridine synthase DusB [unclassified Micromonospora]|uniref:tRNA dihydrouridine synthase DusB n=1 Tax=unclassified Micromonospora TaxID=2617518 RepID=UPI0022B6D0C4|nr:MULTISPECIES: tRNA dihydrouridine synthase DusB [unclassified Micromonospora]MCZ7418450.1 tRNA dihydrouridine synthase DusB [Verrucosispora sp. WMMA2121]WBB94378.1 tRNA dihydrouridine synthase DusB [Verrucosispora sp. WMMC514]